MIGDRGSRIRDGGSSNCRILVGLGDVLQTVRINFTEHILQYFDLGLTDSVTVLTTR